MSKLKTPREKKLASLALDGRNMYGENDKASRKSIPKGKQRSHKVFRRVATELLHKVDSALTEDEIVALEAKTRSREVAAKRNAFRKKGDIPLGAVVAYQETGDYDGVRRARHDRSN